MFSENSKISSMWSVDGGKSGFGVGGLDCHTRFESESCQHVQFMPEYSKEARADMDMSSSESCWYSAESKCSFSGVTVIKRRW